MTLKNKTPKKAYAKLLASWRKGALTEEELQLLVKTEWVTKKEAEDILKAPKTKR